jgi:transcriptional regulator with XRE-family HTH domain
MPRKTDNPLVSIRRKAGYSSAEKAAKAMGISRVHLAQIEAGQGEPSWALIARMIGLYHVSEKFLRFQIRKARRGALKRKLART